MTDLVAAGERHCLAITERAEVLAWGANSDGQVGDGTLLDCSEPKLVFDEDIIAVAAGRRCSLALSGRGQVFAWGCNKGGILGVASGVEKQLRPAPVVGLENAAVMAIAAGGEHCLAVTEGGEVFAWGGNSYGQLGDGTTTLRCKPAVLRLHCKAKTVAAGWYHSLVLLESGEVLAWGFNTPDNSGFHAVGTPRVVLSMGIKQVAAGGLHSLALNSDGVVLAWGGNEYGQLGDGSTSKRLMPVAVVRSVARISAGTYTSLAVTDDDELLCWGFDPADFDTPPADEPNRAQNQGRTRPVPIHLAASKAHTVAAGGTHSLCVSDEGELFTWGGNAYGQLGDGSTSDRGQPMMILGHGTVPVITRAERVAALMAGLAQEVAPPEDHSHINALAGPGQPAALADGTMTPAMAAAKARGSAATKLPDILLRSQGLSRQKPLHITTRRAQR